MKVLTNGCNMNTKNGKRFQISEEFKSRRCFFPPEFKMDDRKLLVVRLDYQPLFREMSPRGRTRESSGNRARQIHKIHNLQTKAMPLSTYKRVQRRRTKTGTNLANLQIGHVKELFELITTKLQLETRKNEKNFKTRVIP